MVDNHYPAFLEADITPASYTKARVHIIPVGLEKSVSYGKGAAAGPGAILIASQQLEAFDGKTVPGRIGIHTHSLIPCNGVKVEEDLEKIGSAVRGILENGAVPIILGGEHTVTLGALRPFKERGESIGIVQFDAHADLRDTYEGNPLSHACVMRRVLDMDFPVMQIGIRSLSEPEEIYRRENRVPCLDGESLYRNGIPEKILPPDFPEKIYITFDVDCLDPSVMPATGTPEPGGLTWYQAVDLLAKVSDGRIICGADVVELAPREGLHAADFTAAKLVYTLVSLISKK